MLSVQQQQQLVMMPWPQQVRDAIQHCLLLMWALTTGHSCVSRSAASAHVRMLCSCTPPALTVCQARLAVSCHLPACRPSCLRRRSRQRC